MWVVTFMATVIIGVHWVVLGFIRTRMAVSVVGLCMRVATEASRIAPMWHAWLHHTQDDAPSSETQDVAPFFLRPPRPNWTGTAKAWLPQAAAQRNRKRSCGNGRLSGVEP